MPCCTRGDAFGTPTRCSGGCRFLVPKFAFFVEVAHFSRETSQVQRAVRHLSELDRSSRKMLTSPRKMQVWQNKRYATIGKNTQVCWNHINECGKALQGVKIRLVLVQGMKRHESSKNVLFLFFIFLFWFLPVIGSSLRVSVLLYWPSICFNSKSFNGPHRR